MGYDTVQNKGTQLVHFEILDSQTFVHELKLSAAG